MEKLVYDEGRGGTSLRVNWSDVEWHLGTFVVFLGSVWDRHREK